MRFTTETAKIYGFQKGNKYGTLTKGMSHPAWNKGLKRWWKSSTEFKKGHIPKSTLEGRRRTGLAHKGKPLSEEHKKKLSEHSFTRGKPAWNRGKHSYWLLGNKNCNWKNGVTPLYKSIRKSLEYKLWRRAVYERDNYTCIWCGYRGNKLQADHIKSFCDYPELRFAIDNGRTLCCDCHKKTDTYGRRNK